MSRQPLRQFVRQARPRPAVAAVAIPPTLPRFQSSAACAPLAHPAGSHGRFAPSSESKSYGQPLPSTHPHLLQPGELTPFISAAEYHARRQRLVDSLEDGAVVIIAGGQIQYMTQNILSVTWSFAWSCPSEWRAHRSRPETAHPRPLLLGLCSYRFRQQSNMWYLTGFEEPNSAIVIGTFRGPFSPGRGH